MTSEPRCGRSTSRSHSGDLAAVRLQTSDDTPRCQSRKVRQSQNELALDTGESTAGERDRRALCRDDPPRTPRPTPDHQPTTRRSGAARVRMPLQRSPATPHLAAGCSLKTTPPSRTNQDAQDPTTRPPRRAPPRVSAGRMMCDDFLAPGRHRFRASFRQVCFCTFWRLGFRQSSFRHITRIARRAVPDAWTRPPVSWHAIFSPYLSDQGSAIRSRDISSRPCPLCEQYNAAPRGAATTCIGRTGLSARPVHYDRSPSSRGAGRTASDGGPGSTD